MGSTTAPAPTAEAVLRQAEALLRRWDTPLEATILSVVDRRLTDEIETMAVSLRPDGVARLEANPEFLLDVGADGAAFVLCHEAMHLLLNHLRDAEAEDRAERLAREVVINHWVIGHTGRGLPVSRASGEPTGVDPAIVYADYAATVAAPTTYERFVETDRACAQLLRQMIADLPDPQCEHRPGSDPAAIETAVEIAVQRAHDGDDRLRSQLLGLLDATPHATLWDRVGATDLRGTTSRLGSTGFWRTHLRGVLARRLRPLTVLAYDRKTGWWDEDVFADVGLATDPNVGMPLVPRADRSRRKHAAVFIDTSGSMTDDVIAAVAETVGSMPDADIDWHTFDHEVHPFEPGQPLLGGGGTDFRVIVDHLVRDDRETDLPDAVLVLTDGHAPPIDPPHPERWIWLIVADGDEWPAAAGMQTVTIPELGGAAR